jgi:hypothetical protein
MDARDSRWEAFVSQHPEGSVFHHPEWLRVLAQGQDVRSTCLACVDAAETLHGVLPLMETRGFRFNLGPQRLRKRLSSLPRTPYAGPLVDNPHVSALLVRAAMERVSVTPGVRLELKASSSELDGLVDGVVGVPWKENFVLDIPKDPAQLRFGNSVTRHRIKWAVGKAARLGVQVRRADTENDLKEWYGLYAKTMRWHGSLPRCYRFFTGLWEHLRPRGLMRLLLAEQHKGAQRRILAGYMLLMFGQTVHCYLNGRRAEDLGLHPNDIIQWEAIHDASREGYRFYNFLEVQDGQAGLADYKMKWGARPVRSHRYYHPPIQEFQPTTSIAPGPFPNLMLAAWRRVPLKATELVSSYVHPYL